MLAIRAVALERVDRAEAKWHDLASSRPEDRVDGGSAEEALHDFRVAIRSLRSWVRAHDDVLDVPRRIRRRLKRAAGATGEARDAEALGELLSALDNLPRQGRLAVRWCVAQLQQQALDPEVVDRMANDVKRGLSDLRDELEVVRLRQRVDEEPRWARNLAADLVPRLTKGRDELRRLLDELAAVDSAMSTSSLSADVVADAGHQTRIAGKRLRYLLEPIAEQADEIPAAIKQLKALQDVLGDLHDLHVAIGSVKALAQRRIRFEADERSREFLDADQEGRPPRRTNSMLSGFGAIATALADRERASALELRDQWLREGTTTLFAKIARAIEAVRRIGQNGQEIERKYLLSEKPVPTPGPRVVVSEIEQGYLPGARIQERIRRERVDGMTQFTRTVKLGHGLVRTEIEEPVDAEIFDRLWPLTEGRRVVKRRTIIEDPTGRWSIDEFLDRALVLAEIELSTRDQEVVLPDWLSQTIVRDVTDEPTYSNVALAQ